MSTLLELKARALALPPDERASLAEDLLISLPHDQEYQEEGMAEALRRIAEMEANPAMAITLEELDASFRRPQR